MCYNVYGGDFRTQKDMQDFLIKQGFEVGDYFKICKNENDVGDAIEELSRIRPTLDFLIDGIVFKVNDLNQRDALGETENSPGGQSHINSRRTKPQPF